MYKLTLEQKISNLKESLLPKEEKLKNLEAEVKGIRDKLAFLEEKRRKQVLHKLQEKVAVPETESQTASSEISSQLERNGSEKTNLF